MGLQTKAGKFKVAEYDDDSMTIKAYGAVFNNVDSDLDIIQKGAFTRSIKEWGPEGKDRIKLIAQHDLNRPIARITEMKEDAKGLYIEAKFGDWTDSKDYYAMAKAGAVNELSIGYKVLDSEDNEHGGRDLKQIKLYEISMVTVASNDEAVIMDVKSMDPLKLVDQIEDKDLAFKLEHEILKLQSKAEEATIETESDLAVKEDSSEQEVEAKEEVSITNQLLNIYQNGK